MYDSVFGGYAGRAGDRGSVDGSKPVQVTGLVRLVLRPDVERSENAVLWLKRCCLPHVYKFFGIAFATHSGFQQLHVFELNQDAVEFFDMTLYALLKSRAGFNTSDNVYPCALPVAESAKPFDLRICF
jgi:hypothetical protein